MKARQTNFIFFLSFTLALWFAIFGSYWTYGAALVIAYPAGISSLLLWQIGKRRDPKVKRYKSIPIILAVGLTLSLSVLVYLLIFD